MMRLDWGEWPGDNHRRKLPPGTAFRLLTIGELGGKSKKMKVMKACCLVVFFAACLAATSAHATCTKATLTGVWGFSNGHSVGQITFDGSGHITAESETIMSGGVESTATATGTYSVASNCTGTGTLNYTGGPTINISIVLYNTNKSLQIIVTTPSYTVAGTASAQGTGTCGLSGKRQTWSANLVSIYADTNAYVAQLIFDGAGGVTGSGNFVVNGTNTKASTIAGTYTEAANCTGTLTITPHGFGTLNFTYVSVNSGKELLLLETDSGTEVNGVMQQ